MRIPPAILRQVADGSVTLAFRRWEVPRVRGGGRQRTAVGVIAFDAVEVVRRDEIRAADAVAAGFGSLAELLAFVDRRGTGSIHRIRLRHAGADPRVALRETLPDADQLREIVRRLARMDTASPHGPWTAAVLDAIDRHPGVRAADLAADFGRERLAFKIDVRKLKELGLTVSLPRGYRLSARGRAVLKHLAAAGEPAR